MAVSTTDNSFLSKIVDWEGVSIEDIHKEEKSEQQKTDLYDAVLAELFSYEQPGNMEGAFFSSSEGIKEGIITQYAFSADPQLLERSSSSAVQSSEDSFIITVNPSLRPSQILQSYEEYQSRPFKKCKITYLSPIPKQTDRITSYTFTSSPLTEFSDDAREIDSTNIEEYMFDYICGVNVSSVGCSAIPCLARVSCKSHSYEQKHAVTRPRGLYELILRSDRGVPTYEARRQVVLKILRQKMKTQFDKDVSFGPQAVIYNPEPVIPGKMIVTSDSLVLGTEIPFVGVERGEREFKRRQKRRTNQSADKTTIRQKSKSPSGQTDCEKLEGQMAVQTASRGGKDNTSTSSGVTISYSSTSTSYSGSGSNGRTATENGKSESNEKSTRSETESSNVTGTETSATDSRTRSVETGSYKTHPKSVTTESSTAKDETRDNNTNSRALNTISASPTISRSEDSGEAASEPGAEPSEAKTAEFIAFLSKNTSTKVVETMGYLHLKLNQTANLGVPKRANILKQKFSNTSQYI